MNDTESGSDTKVSTRVSTLILNSGEKMFPLSLAGDFTSSFSITSQPFFFFLPQDVQIIFTFHTYLKPFFPLPLSGFQIKPNYKDRCFTCNSIDIGHWILRPCCRASFRIYGLPTVFQTLSLDRTDQASRYPRLPGARGFFSAVVVSLPHHTLWQERHGACLLSTLANVLGRVVDLMLQMRQGPQWVSLLLFLTVQFWALPASRHSQPNCSVPAPKRRLRRSKAQSGQGLTGPGSRFCRCRSPKSRHLWPPDVWVTPFFLMLKKSPHVHFLESRSFCFLLRVSIGGWVGVSKIYEYLQSGLKVLDDIV